MNSVCPICSGTQYNLIGKPKTNPISKDFINNDYKVVQCNNCEVYFVSPRITFDDEQWSKLYNSEYFSSQSDWLIRKRAAELSKRFDNALNYLSNGKNISFLDVGSGEGKTLVEGFKRGWDVTGIDIVDNRIDEAKKDGMKFITAKFLEYELPENHFDFVYLDSVLEHVINPREYLEKIKRVMKVGGIVYIGVPNEDSLFNYIRRMAFNLTGKKNISEKIKPFDSPYHIIGFNKTSLKYIFSKTDLEIVDFRNIGRKFNFLSFKPNEKGFWINLIFLLPIEIIGSILNRDVYFGVYITKRK